MAVCSEGPWRTSPKRSLVKDLSPSGCWGGHSCEISSRSKSALAACIPKVASGAMSARGSQDADHSIGAIPSPAQADAFLDEQPLVGLNCVARSLAVSKLLSLQLLSFENERLRRPRNQLDCHRTQVGQGTSRTVAGLTRHAPSRWAGVADIPGAELSTDTQCVTGNSRGFSGWRWGYPWRVSMVRNLQAVIWQRSLRYEDTAKPFCWFELHCGISGRVLVIFAASHSL